MPNNADCGDNRFHLEHEFSAMEHSVKCRMQKSQDTDQYPQKHDCGRLKTPVVVRTEMFKLYDVEDGKVVKVQMSPAMQTRRCRHTLPARCSILRMRTTVADTIINIKNKKARK